MLAYFAFPFVMMLSHSSRAFCMFLQCKACLKQSNKQYCNNYGQTVISRTTLVNGRMQQYSVSSPLSLPRSALLCRTDLHFHWTLRSEIVVIGVFLLQVCTHSYLIKTDKILTLFYILFQVVKGACKSRPQLVQLPAPFCKNQQIHQ